MTVRIQALGPHGPARRAARRQTCSYRRYSALGMANWSEIMAKSKTRALTVLTTFSRRDAGPQRTATRFCWRKTIAAPNSRLACSTLRSGRQTLGNATTRYAADVGRRASRMLRSPERHHFREDSGVWVSELAVVVVAGRKLRGV